MKFNKKRVKELYRSGLSIQKISKKINVTYGKLHYYLKNSNVVFRKKNRSSLYAHEVELLYVMGFSQRMIANQFKVSQGCVCLFMKRNDIKARNVGRPWGERKSN